jgi:hypothetical protein
MAILTPLSNSLSFQQPDIYKGASALGQGIQAISVGLDKRQFNQERKAFIDGLQQPGDQWEAQLPGNQMEANKTASGGYEGPGDAWQRKQDMAAARARSFGVDTGGYDNIRNREAAEAAAVARREHEMEMLEAKQKADEAEKQVALQEKIKDKLSPHDRIAISLLNSGIKTDSDKARAWDAYSSVRGVKGTGADIESLASLVGNQNLFFDELKKEIRPNATKAIDEIIRGNIAKGIPLSFAALAEKIGGSEPDKLKFQTQFQRIAQKHLDPGKLTTALAEIYDPQQREVYRNAMGLEQPQAAPEQIKEQQFDNYLNSMTDEHLAAFMKRMGIM